MKASQRLTERFIRKFKLQDRLGYYGGKISVGAIDKKEGYLIINSLNYNPKTNKYDYDLEILPREDEEISLWRMGGEINPEEIRGKSLDNIIKDLRKIVKEQNENSKKYVISSNEEYLFDMINRYSEVYLLKTNPDKFKKSQYLKSGFSMQEILHKINESYKSRLDILKKLNINISEYPKDLGELFF